MPKDSVGSHHGRKTNRAIINSLRIRHENHIEVDDIGHPIIHKGKGKHHIFEDRQQHDDADRVSEKKRKSKDNLRHHHNLDNYGLPKSGNR